MMKKNVMITMLAVAFGIIVGFICGVTSKAEEAKSDVVSEVIEVVETTADVDSDPSNVLLWYGNEEFNTFEDPYTCYVDNVSMVPWGSVLHVDWEVYDRESGERISSSSVPMHKLLEWYEDHAM